MRLGLLITRCVHEVHASDQGLVRLEVVPLVRHVGRVKKARGHRLTLLNRLVMTRGIDIENKYLLHSFPLVDHLMLG